LSAWLTMATSVQIKDLSLNYGAVKVLDRLNLDIADGEFIVLLGPSGCGKSTTLNMIAGLEDVTEGNLSFDGQPMNTVPPHRRDVAMVFQSYALYPHKTVYDNIAFGLKMRKFAKDEIDRRVRSAAQRLEIEPLLQRRPDQLSGGQRQRVALGRAMVRQPQVFLMDEPLSNLDAALRISMRAEIKQLHQSMQTTFVYVTHDQAEALTLADRIVVMRGGVVQQVGTPDAIYERPGNMFVAAFLGNPPINFLEGQLRREGGGRQAVQPGRPRGRARHPGRGRRGARRARRGPHAGRAHPVGAAGRLGPVPGARRGRQQAVLPRRQGIPAARGRAGRTGHQPEPAARVRQADDAEPVVELIPK
jgi:ABC-type sugar transport system ATPase subunit